MVVVTSAPRFIISELDSITSRKDMEKWLGLDSNMFFNLLLLHFNPSHSFDCSYGDSGITNEPQIRKLVALFISIKHSTLQ
jgi:hypothetical protein